MTARTPRADRRRLRTAVLTVGGIVAISLGVGAYAFAGVFEKPPHPFDAAQVPAEPDYASAGAWLAWPGRNGRERSTPPGATAIDEATAPADVFFIHPTTYRGNTVWNVPYDAPDDVAVLNPAVLLDQVSVFNGCCRLFAPHYRQATVVGLGDRQAVALAYSDVARAFRYFIAHENKGRPFIIASHSQGTIHAVELLQREIIGTPLQKRLVAAYLIGGYVPDAFPSIGLPICDAPDQTGCVLSYNSAKPGAGLARMVIKDKTYWWRGELRDHDQPPAICVDPLSWKAGGSSPASANAGSNPFPESPFPAKASPLVALQPHKTGAACRDGMLDVELAGSRDGFRDKLSRFFGSYHIMDYGLFYASLRRNAMDRVSAWEAKAPEK